MNESSKRMNAYIIVLRRMVSLRGQVPLHRWSFFAGGGGSCKWLGLLDAFLWDRYQIPMQHKTVVLAEIDEWKQQFLRILLLNLEFRYPVVLI